MSTGRLVAPVLFVAIFAMVATRGQPADTDTWWHLKSGQLMWESGQLLRTDPFSHTAAGRPWIDHSWLAQLVLWGVYRAGGLAGLALLLAGAVTTAFALVYRQCEGRPYAAAFAVLLAAVSSSVIWAIRPQIVSFLLAALIAALLHGYRRTGDTRRLWPIPLLVAVWVNSHAGFVIAFLLVGCTLAGELLNWLTGPRQPEGLARPGALAAVLGASAAAVLLNPHTIRLVPYAYQTVSIGPLQSFIAEWAAPDFHRLQFHPFLWLLLLTLVAMVLARQRVDWTDLAMVGVFGYLGLMAVRNIALFGLVAAPVLARYGTAAAREVASAPRLAWLARLAPRPAARPAPLLAVLNAALLILVVAAAAAAVGLNLARVDRVEVWGQGLPAEAAEYLRDNDLPGRLFNTYNWGGYLIWALYPQEPVFVDGRTDLYAFEGVLDDYVQVHLARPGWRDVLARYGVGHVLTEEGGLLATVMDEADDWQAVYRDGLAVVYVPVGGEP